MAIWGTVCLEVRFESIWFLPPDTYLRQWFEATDDYFPGDGEIGTVYITGKNRGPIASLTLNKVRNVIFSYSDQLYC